MIYDEIINALRDIQTRIKNARKKIREDDLASTKREYLSANEKANVLLRKLKEESNPNLKKTYDLVLNIHTETWDAWKKETRITKLLAIFLVFEKEITNEIARIEVIQQREAA